MKSQGYQLMSQTTFDDGGIARVLSPYTKRDTGMTGFWYLPANGLPEPFIGSLIRNGDRVFCVATRPDQSSWCATIGSIRNTGIEWSFHKDLSGPELGRTLREAKGKGFRPESLFVCPTADNAEVFCVALSRDNTDLLWDVLPSLSPRELVSETKQRAARGYVPDQVVGYAVGGESRYLACWTRDPRHYPVTGLGDPSAEAADEALEQFLIERRVPRATFAVFRKDRLVMSRGYGHSDPNGHEPTSTDERAKPGALASPFAAAAVHSLIVCVR
jgi:hypothetical protein